tara:strand:+ start:209 stop:475 length:267 start_codon:yes stop_codon:yes gene_type:complete
MRPTPNSNLHGHIGFVDPNSLPSVNRTNAAGWTALTATIGGMAGFLFLDNMEAVRRTGQRLKTGAIMGVIVGAAVGVITSGGTYLYQQ